MSAVVAAGGITALAFVPTIVRGSGAPRALGGITLAAAPINPGSPSISDSLAGKPILTVSSGGLAVGKALTGSVVITNTSNAPLTVTLAQQNLVTRPSGKPDLATWAQLTVQDTTLNQQIYSGTVAGFWTKGQTLCGAQVSKQSACPRWGGGESHTFLFTLIIPNPAKGSTVNINSYQGTSLSTDFLWTSET